MFILACFCNGKKSLMSDRHARNGKNQDKYLKNAKLLSDCKIHNTVKKEVNEY